MRRRFYTISQKCKDDFLNSCIRKTTFYILVFFGLVSSLSAQEHHHDHDTQRVMLKNDFTVSLINHTNNQIQLEVKYNLGDSVTPLFMEFSAGGFTFTNECILHQSINNVNVESNIEKLWGPEFVALGVGALPPNGRYVANLATLNELLPGSTIKVRIYGSIHGQDFIWSGIIRK